MWRVPTGWCLCRLVGKPRGLAVGGATLSLGKLGALEEYLNQGRTSESCQG